MEFETGSGPLPPEYHRFLGSKTGIVTALSVTPPARGGIGTYVSAANAADPAVVRDAPSLDVDLATGGKAVTPDDVLVGAVGETVERYAHWLPDESAIRLGTHAELAGEGRVVPFEYLTVQRRGEADGPSLPPLSRDTTLAWTAGTDLLTGEPVALPAELVWNGVPELVDVPPRFAGTTSGSAAGESMTAALLGGLLEVVERDGLMRTWLTQRPPPAIDPAERPSLSRAIDELVSSPHLTVHLFEPESKPAPRTVGVAVVDERGRRPAFVVGSAAGFDVETAALDALSEAAQSRQYVQDLLAFEDREPVAVDDPMTDFDDNVLLYSQPEQRDRVSVLLDGDPVPVDGPPPVASESTDAKLDAVLGALAAADCTPIAVDATTPDVAAVGVRVVTVFVPELLPLTPPSLPPVEHPALADEDPTTLPHPYP